ncbi:condensation domain-containing protein, partial [Pseudoalteromonas sp. P1-9]|uniref:condensation domain-containing protein n=1 Tax=Pseudoalteromonas sp. P1-9 TaxID=1710354 RepID=UPI000A4BB03E
MTPIKALLALLKENQLSINLGDDGNLKVRGHTKNLTAELAEKVKEQKTDLIKWIKKQKYLNAIDELKNKPIEQSTNADLSLSYSQQRLWFVDQIEENNTAYNMFFPLGLNGKLDLEALQKSLITLINRHEVLRTTFVKLESGKVRPVINAIETFELVLSDLSCKKAEIQKVFLNKLISQEINTSFDLSQDNMVRAKLVKLAEEEHVLLFTVHHIASDGWSQSILVNEFSALYRANVTDTESQLPPMAIQYQDYAQWQREFIRGEVLDYQLAYWSDQLAEIPPVHDLPLDFPRPSQQSHSGSVFEHNINQTTVLNLKQLCTKFDVTLFMLLETAFSLLVSRLSNKQDIVIGTPIAGRHHEDTEGLLGFFVNNLVLRTDLSENQAFNALLAENKQTILDAYSYQYIPFELLVENLQPERNLSHNPIFQIVFGLNNNKQSSFSLPDLTLFPVDSDIKQAKVDLELSIVEDQDGLYVNWIYNTNLFSNESISRFADYFQQLIEQISQDPFKRIGDYSLHREDDLNLLTSLNQTDLTYETKPLISQFIQQAKATPDAIALRCQEETLTYQALASQAERLAHY